MFASSLLRCSLIALALTGGCASVPEAPPEPVKPAFVDPSAPDLKLESQGLRHNLLLDQKSKRGTIRRVRSSDRIEFTATASDRETGVRFVRLQGELKVQCLASDGERLLSRMEPVFEEQAPQIDRVKDTEIMPRQLSKRFVLDVSAERKKCAGGRFRDMRLELTAETVNGQGQVSRSQPAILRFFGPDQINVGVFNVQGGFGYSDTDYLRWGATLGQMVDVLLLNGVPDRRRAELVATMAGLPHVAVMRDDQADVAILSKAPLQDVERKVIAPQGELLSRLSNLLSAKATFENYPIQFVSARFGLHDDKDTYVGPEQSSPSRVKAAQTVLDLMGSESEPMILGGNLNAYSGIGPQLQPNVKTEELELLTERLLDPMVLLQLPNSMHCSDQRIDYLMSNIAYVPTRYQACFPEAAPSNRPFILVTFEVP